MEYVLLVSLAIEAICPNDCAATGSFVVESIFSIPGIGREFTNAITNRDYTVVLGFSVFIGVIITVANLAVDIICSLIDPRIKLTN